MRETGAESMRELPTLTLFKINMNLEMEKGTDALAAAVEAAPPRELERAALRRRRHRRDPGPAGADGGGRAPLRRGRGRAGDRRPRSCSSACAAMVDRKILRRVAAILFHRRAGFSANGMGVWKVPEEEIMEIGGRMASFRGISHCYQRPTYEDWPYSVFTMAHGRSKEECDAILDSIAEECGMGPDDRATLYSSTEYKKIRLHYFTDDYAALGGASIPELRALGCDALRAARCEVLPGWGQLAGPGDAADRPRADLHRARRGLRAGRRRRQPLPRLGRLLGAADPRPRRPGGRRRGRPRRPRAGPATAPRPRPRSSWPRRSPTASPRSRWCG